MKFLGHIVVLFLAITGTLLSLLWLILAALTGSPRLWPTVVALDVAVNVALGGKPDLTISGRCYEQSSSSRKYVMLMRLIDWGFYNATGEVDHCKNAYLADIERAKRLVDQQQEGEAHD